MEGEVRAVVSPATQVVAEESRPISVYRPIGQYQSWLFSVPRVLFGFRFSVQLNSLLANGLNRLLLFMKKDLKEIQMENSFFNLKVK